MSCRRGHHPHRRNFYLSHHQDGDQDVFSSVASEPAVEYRDSYNTRLVDILREENLTLKKELESYYNRVRKLQKVGTIPCLCIGIWHESLPL